MGKVDAVTLSRSNMSHPKYYSGLGWSEILEWRAMGLAGKPDFLSVWFPEQQGNLTPLSNKSFRALWADSDL